MTGPSSSLNWVDADHLELGGIQFLLSVEPATEAASSDADRFVLGKSRLMIEDLIERAPDRTANIVDLGILAGGSIALFQELFRPTCLIGVERTPDRVKNLDEFIEQRSLGDAIRLYYGVSQQDKERLSQILRTDFGDVPLDLVVDDCSHRYGPTKASFNVLFPHLRPGGLYVIEDWGWAHWAHGDWQGSGHQFADLPTPLSRLILELVMVSQSRPRLVQRVDLAGTTAYITRGDEIVPRGSPFDVSECYLTAGREILCDGGARPRTTLGQRARNLVHRHPAS